MDRITDDQAPQAWPQMRPVDPLASSKPVRSGAGDEVSRAPYGVIDRVTLSPEGRAMAMQQRAALPGQPLPKTLTYGPPGMRLTQPVPRLPYKPES